MMNMCSIKLGSETARQLFNAEGRTPGPIRRMTTDAGVTAMSTSEGVRRGPATRMVPHRPTQRPKSPRLAQFFLIDPDKEGLMRTGLLAPPADASTIAVFHCQLSSATFPFQEVSVCAPAV
jgi:hypothetical protein